MAKAASEAGYQTEVYHCGFDSDSLDMVIVRALDFAIFDSTLPHEHFPSRKGDELIDFYGTFIKASTDRDYDEQITHSNNQINDETKRAIKLLQQDEQLKKQQGDHTPESIIAFNDRLTNYFKKTAE